MEQEKFQRKRQSHWDKLHLKTVSTHLTMQEFERLQVVCRYTGKRPYELIRAYLKDYTATMYERLDGERYSAGGYHRFGGS